MSNVPTNLSEYDVISKIVQHYIDGAKSGRGDDMKPAFHPTLQVGKNTFVHLENLRWDFFEKSRSIP